MSVRCHHDVRRVNITVDIARIMQRHQSRQHVDDNNLGKVFRVVLEILLQLHGISHILAITILRLTLEDV